MKKLLFTLFIITFGLSFAVSQPCLPEGITFTTQEQIDNFHIDYPSCNVIGGDVKITGDAITNLNGLLGIKRIEGHLKLEEPDALVGFSGLDSLNRINGTFSMSLWDCMSITSFQGLEKLDYVGGISFGDVENIDDFTGLNSLDTIGGSLYLVYSQFESLNGLENVKYIAGSVHLESPPPDISGLSSLTYIGGEVFMLGGGMENFIGWDNLTYIGGKLQIIFAGLQNCQGLNSLSQINGNVSFMDCSSLTSLQGLESLSTIGGNLSMTNNSEIQSLSGLTSLETINGNLYIADNSNLQNILDLENLAAESINDVNISGNSSLCQCEAESICNYLSNPNGSINISNNADGCNSIEEVETICNNQSCPDDNFELSSQQDVDSFQVNYPGCTEINGDLLIEGNSIENLDGLEVLANINGSLTIKNNPILQNLDGLENVTQIDGALLIQSNPIVETLDGIKNILHSSITDIVVVNNVSLNTCHVLGICSFLASPNTNILISGNAIGCENVQQVEDSCVLITCFPNGIEFTSQSEIDDFENLYPGCHSIEGDVEIHGWGIQNLDGLNFLQYIGGNLDISNVSNLEILNGLNNLTYIGEDFVIENTGITELSGFNSLVETGNDLSIENNSDLANITGLESLIEIGDDLIVNNNTNLTSVTAMNSLTTIQDDCYFIENTNLATLSGLNGLQHLGGKLQIADSYYLTDLNSLSSLTSMDGSLIIQNNIQLASLNGLGNIQSGSLQSLIIEDNSALEECAIECICDYLLSPTGTLRIENNASGCNSTEEVEQACLYISVFNQKFNDYISVFPNPTENIIFIECATGVNIHEANLYTLNGETISGIHINNFEIDVSKIANGLYVLEVISSKAVSRFTIQIN